MNLNALYLYWIQLSSWQRRLALLLFCALPWLSLYRVPEPAPSAVARDAEPPVQALPLFSDSQLQKMLQQHDIQIQQLVFQPRGLQLRFSSSWLALHSWLTALAASSHELHFYQLQHHEGIISGQLTLNRGRYQLGPELARIESLFSPPSTATETAHDLTPCPPPPAPDVRLRAIWPQRGYIVLSKTNQPAPLQTVYLQHLLPGEDWRLTAIQEKSIEISAVSTHLNCSHQLYLSMN